MRVKRVETVGGAFYGLRMKCPGCGDHLLPIHGMTLDSTTKAPKWNFNGDYERPTLTPSILSRWYEMSDDSERRIDAGEKLPAGLTRWPGRDMVCHSFVTGGRIQFLNDCTHALAGQTVDLPELPDSA